MNNYDKSNAYNTPKEEITSLAQAKDGVFFKGTVKIMRKAKPGPVIFIVSDGTGNIDAVIKDSTYEVDQVVTMEGPVSERAGKLQIEIKSMAPSNKDFEEILDERAKPIERPFSIESDRFEKLSPYFLKIAKRIRRAIVDNQPLLIRHHADADGIVSGMVIEQASAMFMEEVGVEPDYNLYRSPSKAPFYEITDMLKDISFTKRIIEGHGQKKPLILVLDNGSTPEDVFAHKTLKMLGFEIIVVDHHNPVILKDKKTAVCPYLTLHLNPYMEGLDGQTSAGMLCYELARLIHEKYDNPVYPAVTGISDRCDIPETDRYIEKSGKSKEELTNMGTAIDFLAYSLRFDPGRGIYEEIFKKPEFVKMINEKVKQGVETQLQSTMPYLRTQDINGVIFSHIDIEKYTVRFTYPNPGKVVGHLHDSVAEGKDHQPVITFGLLPDMIIIRATKPVLPVATIIENLQRDLPTANVDGGGHECAGTIKFVSAFKDEVLENIKNQIKDLKWMDN